MSNLTNIWNWLNKKVAWKDLFNPIVQATRKDDNGRNHPPARPVESVFRIPDLGAISRFLQRTTICSAIIPGWAQQQTRQRKLCFQVWWQGQSAVQQEKRRPGRRLDWTRPRRSSKHHPRIPAYPTTPTWTAQLPGLPKTISTTTALLWPQHRISAHGGTICRPWPMVVGTMGRWQHDVCHLREAIQRRPRGLRLKPEVSYTPTGLQRTRFVEGFFLAFYCVPYFVKLYNLQYNHPTKKSAFRRISNFKL